MEPFITITSRAVPLPNENVDTDIIVPARFLKVTDKLGMDRYLFRDWRFDAEGTPRTDFILNQPRARGAQILLVGRNFGSGSSREHAPWALLAFGFRALIGTSFADIFRGNALKNGLLPVVVPSDFQAELFHWVEQDPEILLTIDLPSQMVVLPDRRSVPFPIDKFSKQCLLAGVEQLGYLLKQESLIRAYENSHPPLVQTTQSF